MVGLSIYFITYIKSIKNTEPKQYSSWLGSIKRNFNNFATSKLFRYQNRRISRVMIENVIIFAIIPKKKKSNILVISPQITQLYDFGRDGYQPIEVY